METVLFSLGGTSFTVPAVASLLTAALALGLGVRVLLREQRAEESLYFLFFCIVLFLWELSFGLMYASRDAATARDWMQTGYMAIPFVPATIYRFTVQILGSNPRRRVVMGGIWVAAALLVVLFVGGGIFTEGMIRYEWGWIEALNARGFVFVAFLVTTVAGSIFEFQLVLRTEESPRRRRPLRLIQVAFLIGGLAIVDFLPSFGVAVPPFGYLFVLGGLLVLANVVQRHRLVELTPSFTADTILRTMSDPVVVVEEDGSIRFASEAVRETLGWSPEELRDAGWGELLEGEGERGVLRRLLEADGPADAEIRFSARDGEEIPTSVSASPVTDLAERKVGTVLVIRDLRTREAARRAVEEAEQKFAGLFELNPLAIGLATLDGSRFLEVNESFEAFFGIPRERAVGRSPVDLGLWVNPADRDRVVRAVESGNAVEGTEVQMRAAGGEVRDVLFFADAIELEDISALLAMAYDITDRKAFERELERRALYDPLTDLPNRSLLRDRLGHALDRARRQGTSVGVLFVDLDRFKIVNDSMGHAAGDEVLRQTARRLQGLVREEDTVARMGGDEFVIVLETLDDPAESRQVARRITEELAAPFTVEGQDVHLSASAGIAISEAAETSAEELLRRSDVAMYRAKERRDAGFHVFDPATDRWATERLQEENELRRAIDRDELRLRYQPIVELATGTIVGAEALARWKHPERGLVPPTEFIPMAEETGLIVPLGDWALRHATSVAVGWRPEWRPDGVHLGINVSARQLEDPEAVRRVEEALETSGMSPSRLVLEMTESTAIRSRETVQALRQLGLQVAVDDLGTGYASLEYLTHLDVDLMKVDRLFISGIGEDRRDEAIVEAAALIARRLDKSLVAEGIETEEQLRRVRDLGYAYGQGHYFARPLPAESFESLLRGDPDWAAEPA